MAGIDSNTKACLHFDNNLDDSSSEALAVSANGDAALSNAQSKFGSYSLYCPDASDYISFTTPSSFNFGTGDFTIDFWIKNTEGQSMPHNVYFMLVGGFVFYLYWEKNAGNYGYNGSGISDLDIYSNVITGWQHIAIVRVNGVMKFYQDGVESGSASYADSKDLSGISFMLGNQPYTAGGGYYIDEFRVSNVARWTEAFTPPTQAYSAEATTAVKSVNGLARASVKSVKGLAIASVKSVNGLA